jgi:hypothetical protein
VQPPTLTVERGQPADGPSAGTLAVAETPDDHWGDYIAERRATFVAGMAACLDASVRHITSCVNEDVLSAEQRARFKPKAIREEWLARERQGWSRMGREAIEELEEKHAQAITPCHALPSGEEPETRRPGVYASATPGLGLSLTLVEAEGVTARVQVGGDASLQAQILEFLVNLGADRASMRARTE